MLLHLPQNLIDFVTPYVNGNIVKLIPHETPECVKIIKSPCACETPNGMAVFGNSVLLARNESWLGHIGYSLDQNITEEELEVVILWLARTRLQVLGYAIESGSMRRFLNPAVTSFKPVKHACTCEKYVLNETPVIFLKQYVVSNKKKGPTIESVLNV